MSRLVNAIKELPLALTDVYTILSDDEDDLALKAPSCNHAH